MRIDKLWEEHKTKGKIEKNIDMIIKELSKLRPIEKEAWLDKFSKKLNVSPSILKEEVREYIKEQQSKDKALIEKQKQEEKEDKEIKKDLAKRDKEEKLKQERLKKEQKKWADEDDKIEAKQEFEEKIKGDLPLEVLHLIASKQEDKATELISEKIQNKYHFFATKNDIKSEMWIYDNGIYEPHGNSHIKLYCRKVMGEAYNSFRAKQVIDKINADNQIDEEYFFNRQSENITEIPIQNGILNIFTREISPFTHQKIFFNKLPVKYDPKAKCPMIEKFFKDILKDEEDAKVMYELIGFCLLKEYRYEKMFMFVGDGRNGKGKTLNLIKRFLGIKNCSAVPLDQMTSGNSAVCELHGKLINISGDLSHTALKETGMLKQLSGRDEVNAKRKYLRDLNFENYGKLTFACNELPRVYDFTYGFWSRWILLDYPYKFVKKSFYDKAEDKTNLKIMDEQIIDKITTQEELNGLLILALDGLERLEKNKDFSYTKGTKEVKDMWIRKSDSFTAFCMDKIIEDYKGYIEKGKLRREFHKYCKVHKIGGASDKGIKATLENLYGATEERKGSYDNLIRIWSGINFNMRGDNDK